MKLGLSIRLLLACGFFYGFAMRTMSNADDAKTPAPVAQTGAEIYVQRCALCHLPEGQGATGVFPPLAKSDWLVKNRERTIRAVCEGMSGRVRVNGADYEGAMPAQAIDDRDVAEVLTYVGKSWGNDLAPFTADEVKAVRAKTKFPTFEKLAAASAYQPLPPAPKGYSVREVVQMPENEFGTRMAGNGKVVYVLTQAGTIWKLDPANGAIEKFIAASDYLNVGNGGISALGLMLAPGGELWISTNQAPRPKSGIPMNEVAIHRIPIGVDGKAGKARVWFSHSYPHGGGFTHGVSNLALGPDGMLYMSSGSRTDGAEKPPNHPDSPAGEVETTACMWRFDPKADVPKVEIFARGLRNVYGFAWDDAGRMFSVTNGPDANAAEEMDLLEQGKHYGFPYQFADWPVSPGKPYPHTPPPPPGLTFTLPVKNLGPAGGAGLATFHPHSSPAGMIWCGSDWPAPLGGGFLVTRYGNLLGADRTGIADDVGFDVLSVHVEKDASGALVARTETVLASLGRPIDVLQVGPGRAFILEYTRPVTFKDGLGWLSGRIIELAKSTQ